MTNSFVDKFVKGVISRSIGSILQLFLGVLSLAIAARIVSREEFGIFVIIQVVTTLLFIFNSLVLQNISVIKHIAEAKPEQTHEVIHTALLANMTCSAIVGLAILLGGPLIAKVFKSEQLVKFIIYIPALYLAGVFDQLFQAVLQGFQQYKKMAFAQVINVSGRILFIYLFLVPLKMGLNGLISAMLASYVFSLAYQIGSLRIKKGFRFNFTLYKKMYRFGYPLGLNDVLNFIFQKIDRLMLGAMVNSTGVANYEIANKIPDASRSLSNSFTDVYFPSLLELITHKKKNEAENVFNESIRIINFFCILITLIFFLFQKNIIVFLFSKKYLESAPALYILMFSLSVGLMGAIMGTSLIALGQSDKPAKVNIVRAASSVAGNLIMIPKYGFMGAVYTTVISTCLTSPLNIWFLIRAHFYVKMMNIYKPIAILAISMSAFLFVKIENVVIKIVIISIYIVMCFILKVIIKDDLHAARKLFMRR